MAHSNLPIRHQKRKDAPTSVFKRQSCSPYGKPESGDEVTAYTKTDITWDVDCLDGLDLIDIYLYDVSGDSTTPLHGWANVPTQGGNLSTTFYPTWWNATKASDRELQLQYINAGDPLWASTFSTGPTFTVTWNGTAPPAQVTKHGSWNESVEAVTDPTTDGASLSKGAMAAAILLPILVAIGAVIGYLFWNRRKSESRPKRWSQAVDNRMSMMSAAGDSWAPPAPRPGSVAWSHMQRVSMAAPSMSGHKRMDSNDSTGSFNAAGVGLGGYAGDRRSKVSHHDRSFSNSSKSGHSAKASLSGEVMKELMGSKRASRVSFSQHPTKPSPAALAVPRLGQNGGWRSSMASSQHDPFQDAPESLSPGFMRGHGTKASMSSSLRNEYYTGAQRDSMFGNEELAGAVAMIQGGNNKRSSMGKKRQSQLSQSSPPLSMSAGRRASTTSGYFASQQQQQQYRASSMYSEQDSFTSPSLNPQSSSPLKNEHEQPSHIPDRSHAVSPDAALAAYSAKAQATSQPQSQGKKSKVANLFGRNRQQQDAPPVPALPTGMLQLSPTPTHSTSLESIMEKS